MIEEKSLIKAIEIELVKQSMANLTFCAKAGIPQSYWSMIKSGKRSVRLKDLQRMVNVLGYEINIALKKK